MKQTEAEGKQLPVFFTAVIIITTFIFILMFNGAEDNIGAILVMMWTPGIAALITSAVFRESIRGYGWKPGKMKFLSYAYALPLAVSLIAYGVMWIAGVTEFTAERVINYKWAKMLGFNLPVPLIIGMLSKMTLGFLFTCLFVLGEEIGWTGFLTPRLLEKFSVPVASLITGLVWSVWHYPAIIGGFYGNGAPLWIALPGFTLVLTGYSFLRTVLYIKSGSLWTGVVLHASGNIILMGMFWEMTVQSTEAASIVSETGILTGIVCMAAALIFMKMQMKDKTPGISPVPENPESV
ncbi:MAG: CPBP family intramembrane metalloprotease [Ignavibacteria bacterium]|jgi:membrane protease YdiL (CAAX protease family)|nr:CPBP family intramembrane metalloprotease [Ignavibacteria bacterium]